MPVDDLVGEVVGSVAGEVAGWAVDLVTEQLFSRYTARFFHGVGRRVIAVATFGRKRIPSSLRIVPAGTRPQPDWQDRAALWVGIVSWIILAAILVAGTLAVAHGSIFPGWTG